MRIPVAKARTEKIERWSERTWKRGGDRESPERKNDREWGERSIYK